MTDDNRSIVATNLYRLLRRLNNQRHLYSIRTAFISMMPIMLIGAYAVVLNNLPISGYQRLMEEVFGTGWKNFGGLAFNATLQVAAIMITFLICNNLAQRYNNSKQTTHIHPGICGMIGLASYLVMSLQINDATNIPFFATGVTGLFGAMLVATIAAELFIFLCSSKNMSRYVDDDPDVAVPLAFLSIIPAIIVVSVFAVLRFIMVAFGITEGLTEDINRLLVMPFQSSGNSLGTALLYSISTHLMWLLGIHGNNVLDSVAQGVYAHAGATGEILTKTFFDAFVYMGGSGTTLALLIALYLYSRSRSYRTLFKFALPNSIFNINEPLIFGIPIVLNPIYAIPFILTPLVMLLSTYAAFSWGLVPPIIQDVSWATPIFISGFVATGSVAAIILQLFNLSLAILIYAPFVRLAETLAEMHHKSSYQKLVTMILTDYSSAHNLLKRTDGIGAVARRLANELEGAMGSGEMYMNYQPIMDVKNHKLHSVESLLRWKHPQHGMVNPMLIIALAEEAKQIDKLGLWIMEQAISQRAAWNAEQLPFFEVTVNISSQQLGKPEFSKQVLALLKKYNTPANQIKIEITETMALVENQITRDNLIMLNEAGIGISMDDFGVGHSSLIYLRTMPIGTLKIDRSLSEEIDKNKACQEIVSTIYDLCRQMNIDVVVEYVENENQLKLLMELGEFLIQGYLFSPPRPGNEIPEFIQKYEEENEETT